MLWTDTKELGEKCAEPGTVVVYVFAEASAGESESEERRRGKIGGDVSKRLLGKGK